MAYSLLRDKPTIERILRNDTYLNIYGIGDLDDFFWPYTTWYGSGMNGRHDAVVLVYSGMETPTVLALARESTPTATLLQTIAPALPERFHAHLTVGLDVALRRTHELESFGLHYKMALTRPEAMRESASAVTSVRGPGEIVALEMRDIDEIRALYDESYPGNWFDPRMLETRRYYGVRDAGRLVSIAGIHVYSPRYRVAALGNITTLPAYRGRGFGTLVTAHLCRVLVDEGLAVGLNVKADNHAAIASYRKIGFEIVAPYEEFLVRRRR